MKPLLVLAGGFGTRLRSVVSNVPKSLAPVLGKPFILYLFENWVRQGVKDFIFLLHFESHLIEDVLNDVLKNKLYGNINIDIVVEPTPLGTGGSIYHAVQKLQIIKSFMVANADTWLGSGIIDINESSSNTIAAVEVNECSRYGELILNGGVVDKFLEKNSSNRSGLVNAGIYHLSPKIFNEFSLNENISLESDIFPNMVQKKLLKAIKVNTNFIDIGIPEDYMKFCKFIEEKGQKNV